MKVLAIFVLVIYVGFCLFMRIYIAITGGASQLIKR